MFAWKGAGVSGAGDALGSIQKSQEATKDGHGQVTSHFPSSALYNLSQTIKINNNNNNNNNNVNCPFNQAGEYIEQGGKTTTHKAKRALLPGSRELPGNPGCLGVGLWGQRGRGRGGLGDSGPTQRGGGSYGGDSCGDRPEGNENDGQALFQRRYIYFFLKPIFISRFKKYC